MNGKFILISGSASPTCPQHKLDAACEFVTRFTGEVLRLGGGVVVLAGAEPSTSDDRGASIIFDWVALRKVARYATTTTESPRKYARIVMSDEARESKIDDANLKLLRDLQQRDVVKLLHIERELYTGGEYRKVMADNADAMLAIGGGKGTYSAGDEMTERGKPVLPLDLQLDSSSDDGNGSVALHWDLTSEPCRFFPNTGQDVANKIDILSLERGINDVADVARTAAEMLARELASAPQEERPEGREGTVGGLVAEREQPLCGRKSNQVCRMGEGPSPLPDDYLTSWARRVCGVCRVTSFAECGRL